MPIQLAIKDGQLVISPSDLFVAEINAIWQYDKTAGKKTAQQLLKFVLGMAEHNKDKNPFAKVHYADRDRVVRRNAFGEDDYVFKKNELDMVNKAIDAYALCNDNEDHRAEQTFQYQIDQMTDRMREVKLETKQYEDKKTGEPKWASNSKEISGIANDINALIKARNLVLAQMLENKDKGGRNRKNVELSASEKGLIGYNPARPEVPNE